VAWISTGTGEPTCQPVSAATRVPLTKVAWSEQSQMTRHRCAFRTRELDLIPPALASRVTSRAGRPATSYAGGVAEPQELEETIEVLADSEAVKALIEAREAAARGDVVRGVDAVRTLLDGR
jgi:hypothetical protein